MQKKLVRTGDAKSVNFCLHCRDMKASDEELTRLLELATKATPTPWFVRHLDDSHAMNLVAVSTVADTGRNEIWPDFNANEIVAATLMQEPRYVDVADGKWDENAEYIAAAANVLPYLIKELLELRRSTGGRRHERTE